MTPTGAFCDQTSFLVVTAQDGFQNSRSVFQEAQFAELINDRPEPNTHLLMHSITLNGQSYQLDVPDDMPLLWAIRDVLGFTGTKFGCGISQCGACTVHLDEMLIRSCSTPVSAADGKNIVTIEGIGDDPVGSQVQQAWLEVGVPQCGYCQCGQVMSATALLKSIPSPDNDAIEGFMSGNICRCGTYNRIKTAIHQAASKLKEEPA